MLEVPGDILCLVPDDARPAVDHWWASLTDTERQDAANRWDELHETFFFTPALGPSGQVDEWEQMPRVIGGQFAGVDDSNQLPEWAEEWYEYVVGHEEMMEFYMPILVLRTFCIVSMVPPRPPHEL